MRPLKGDDCRGSNEEKEASKRRFYDLCGEYDMEAGGKVRLFGGIKNKRTVAHWPFNRAMPSADPPCTCQID